MLNAGSDETIVCANTPVSVTLARLISIDVVCPASTLPKLSGEGVIVSAGVGATPVPVTVKVRSG